MIKLSMLCAVVLAASGCGKSSPSQEGTKYGAPLTEVVSLTPADLNARADEFEGKQVRVKGLVVDVCSRRGCWIRLADDKVKFIIGDVRDHRSIKPAMEGVDYVFHAAALKQVPSCEFYPMQAVKTNVIGAENVLDSAADSGV